MHWPSGPIRTSSVCTMIFEKWQWANDEPVARSVEPQRHEETKIPLPVREGLGEGSLVPMLCVGTDISNLAKGQAQRSLWQRHRLRIPPATLG